MTGGPAHARMACQDDKCLAFPKASTLFQIGLFFFLHLRELLSIICMQVWEVTI